jgi:hypothetical protein
VTPDEMRSLALAIPGAEEGFNMGSVVFKVNGKVLARLLGADAMIVGVSFDEREMLLEAEPETFHITDHYRDYPGMLARLASLTPQALESFLWKRWRQVARKADIRAYDARREQEERP